MRAFLFLLLSALVVVAGPRRVKHVEANSQAESYVEYQAGHYVSFATDSRYTRVDYQWCLNNTSQNSDLYFNGNLQSSDNGGNADIGATAAWALEGESISNVVIGLVDSGVDETVPDLNGVVIASNASGDLSYHGTRMAGLIAGKHDGTGISGVADGAKIVSYQLPYNTASEVARGLVWCADHGAKIINLSYTGEDDPTLRAVVSALNTAGIVLVCAVPNTARSIDTQPAHPSSWNLPNILPVTNTTRDDTLFNPAAWGTNVIGAPGRNIVSCSPAGVTYATGTSEATAITTGAVTWLAGRFPNQNRLAIIAMVRHGLVWVDARIQGRLSLPGALIAAQPSLNFRFGGPLTLTVSGIPEVKYQVTRSIDLQTWSDFLVVPGNSTFEIPEGFYRARIL